MKNFPLAKLSRQVITQGSKPYSRQLQQASFVLLFTNISVIESDTPIGNVNLKNSNTVFDSFSQLESEYRQATIKVTNDNRFSSNSNPIKY